MYFLWCLSSYVTKATQIRREQREYNYIMVKSPINMSTDSWLLNVMFEET